MSTQTLKLITGPRIPAGEWSARKLRYLIPSLLFIAAAVLLFISTFMPFWRMTLYAPQYPKGLTVQAHLNKLTGDVREIDGLNHYIGMRPLNDAAKLERELSIIGVIALVMLLAGAVYVHNRWAALLVVPALLFPAVFLLDMYFWLHTFGHTLDPHAPLSQAIKPFTPPVLGIGKIGQFRTIAWPDNGLWLAFWTVPVILAGLLFHRRAYKPLVDVDRENKSEA